MQPLLYVLLGMAATLVGHWISHRRYRLEVKRQQDERERVELEQRKHHLDRDKVDLDHVKDSREHTHAADDSLLRAVELFGHADAIVRAGALHVLAGLAAHSDRTQAMVDLVCLYLRSSPGPGKDPAAREAQRLLHRIVRNANPYVDDLEIDLTGAHLDSFHLGRVIVRALTLTAARLTGHTSLEELRTTLRPFPVGTTHAITFDNATFEGPVLLHNARLTVLSAKSATFARGLSLPGSHIDRDVHLSGTRIAGAAELTDTTIGTLKCDGTHFDEATFRRVTVNTATFVQSRFTHANFDSLTARRIVLDESHFTDSFTFLPTPPPPEVSLRKTTVSPTCRTRVPPNWHPNSHDGTIAIGS